MQLWTKLMSVVGHKLELFSIVDLATIKSFFTIFLGASSRKVQKKELFLIIIIII